MFGILFCKSPVDRKIHPIEFGNGQRVHRPNDDCEDPSEEQDQELDNQELKDQELEDQELEDQKLEDQELEDLAADPCEKFVCSQN